MVPSAVLTEGGVREDKPNWAPPLLVLALSPQRVGWTVLTAV